MPVRDEIRRSAAALASGLPVRLLALAALFSLELIWITSRLHPSHLPLRGWLCPALLAWGRNALDATVAGAALYVTCGILTAKNVFRRASAGLTAMALSPPLLCGHAAALLAFWAASHFLFGQMPPNWPADPLAGIWLLAVALAIATATFAFIPVPVVMTLVRETRSIWLLAVFGGLAAGWIESFRSLLWKPLFSLTVALVNAFLHPFVRDLTVDAKTGAFSCSRFQVMVSPQCAGFEGAGLMLVFTAAWIWIFRRECRLPRVLLLVPLSIAAVWLLNSVRLAALFLIGRAGAPEIAMGGFHSEAGWIAFSGVAVGFTLALNRVPGLTRGGELMHPNEAADRENATAWYLGPFLAILAASMISRAASAQFEWLYPLRFLAAALVLWGYRRRYASLDWRFGWPGVAAGCLAFAMWLGLALAFWQDESGPVRAGLAALPAILRVGWITSRVLAAAVTVPIAEELAFRGYLSRRLSSADFESIDFRRVSALPLLLSSLAFGAMHGSRWMAGTAVGLLYGLALRRRGRMGDAIAAHAITNALLAVCVLITGNWQLW